MILLDVIKDIDSFDDDKTIYAKKPWTINSEALVDFEPESGGNPETAEGFDYFIEVFLAIEFLEDAPKFLFSSVEKRCKRLIEYVIRDA
ncbi:MAG: hypothetical protein HWE27_06840 [Gammaproteobacteria bacterium]|nr:hypothetical protein [Gammaproteobacteria bacterium]